MKRKKGRRREGTPATPAQLRRFALALVETKDEAAAYQRVFGGTSPATAVAEARRLLRNREVQTRVHDAQALREEAERLTVERLDAEASCAALFDPGDILDPETGATLPVHQWPEHARRALAGFEEEALFDMVPTGETGPRGGEKKVRVQVGVVRKFKWHDKTSAQRLCYQRRGALVERHDHTTGGKPLEPWKAEPTHEEMEALALLVHDVRAKAERGAAAAAVSDAGAPTSPAGGAPSPRGPRGDRG